MTASATAKAKLNIVQPSEFETARDEYFALRAERKVLINRCDQMQAALYLSSQPFPLQHSLRSIVTIKAAEDDLALARRNPRRFEVELFDLRLKVEDLSEDFERARDRYERACSDEAMRTATDLVPRHRAAVANIHAALIQMSQALAEEVAIHDEFRANSPTAWPSQFLPNMSAVFKKIALLSHYDSVGSIWLREARARGLIE